jgi:hypothetical protein
VVEGNPTGHRLFYARLLAESAARTGHSVRLVISFDRISSEERRIHLEGLDGSVDLEDSNRFDLRGISDVANRFHSDLTIVPDGDSVALGLGRGSKWTGHGHLTLLVMREHAQPAKIALVTFGKDVLRRRTLKRAAMQRNVTVRVLKSAIWSGGSDLLVVNDPVSLSAGIREIDDVKTVFGMTPDRYWFAVLGAITERKNLPLIAAALTQSSPQRLGLIIAGKIQGEVLESSAVVIRELRELGCKVVVVDRLLTETELDALVQASDCLVLAHSNEGPSGLLGKAAAAGTRIVAAGARSLRQDAALVPSIATWSRLHTSELSQALHAASELQRPDALAIASKSEFARVLLEIPQSVA